VTGRSSLAPGQGSERCRRWPSIRMRPASRTGVDATHRYAMTNDGHAVGAERVKLTRLAVQFDDFEIRISRDQEEAVPSFQQIGAGLAGGGAGEEVEQWMSVVFMIALIQDQRD
jgi:hypothetical protein